uniref:Cell death abnormality protein 1-like n=1 Tax=Crassostrea virginica TaxID=6565 RepID=A0A8B8C461_CRAVI|nr:cell death abnormality protein 1-like [Crassostrea virginica]
MYILLINKVSLSVSLLVHISALSMSTGISKADKINLTDYPARKCVSGFRIIKGECKECIGFYGTNCGQPCVKGFYGEGCRSYCNCSAGQTCNQFVGCIPSGAE